MIRIVPFRRRPAEPEGCAPSCLNIAHALACHKGDSSQSQSNEELGAQTQGVATATGAHSTGSVSSNTGTNIVTAPDLTNTTVQKGASLTVDETTDDDAVSDALDSLQGALSGAASLIQGSQTALLDSTAQNQQLASDAVQQSAAQEQAPATGGFTAWLQGLSPTEVITGIGGVVAALFLIIGLPVIISKKK